MTARALTTGSHRSSTLRLAGRSALRGCRRGIRVSLADGSDCAADIDELPVLGLAFIGGFGRLRCVVDGAGIGLAGWRPSDDGSVAALGPSLLLGLVQLGARLRYRPLELLERRREMWPRQLLKRLGGVVLV